MGCRELNLSASEQGLATAFCEQGFGLSNMQEISWLTSQEDPCSMDFFLIKCKIIIYKTILTQIAARSTLLPTAYKKVAIRYAYIQQHSYENL